MNTVICNVQQCPYRSQNNFCRRKFVSININGQCGHIYDKRGNVKGDWREPVKEFRLDTWREAEPDQEIIGLEQKEDEPTPA